MHLLHNVKTECHDVCTWQLFHKKKLFNDFDANFASFLVLKPNNCHIGRLSRLLRRVIKENNTDKSHGFFLIILILHGKWKNIQYLSVQEWEWRYSLEHLRNWFIRNPPMPYKNLWDLKIPLKIEHVQFIVLFVNVVEIK